MSATNRNRYKPKEYLADCDICSFTFYASELIRRWDGMMVCSKDFEERHPSELIKSRAERSTPKWTRPEPPDIYIVVGPADPDSLGRIPTDINVFHDTYEHTWKDDGDNVWKDD